MDRITTYIQALGRSTDFLQAQQNAMIGLAWEAMATLGSQTAVDGFGLVPTTPASLVANLAPGAIYQLANLEATTWSSLPANTGTSIVKQGLMQAVDPITFTPPAGAGYSQSFLVEAQYADLDTTPTLLPYYNSSNSAQPYQGPNNSGISQNTARLGIVAIQVKTGIAIAGTPVAPTPDPGWVGLYVVTLANGATTVTAGNIATYSLAPFVPVKLPGVPSGVQSGAWVYGAASGTNAYAATLFSTAAYPFALTTGMQILVYFANANTTSTPTLNANGTGARSIVKQGGGAPSASDISGWVPLVFDGTNWRLTSFATSDILALIFTNAIRILPAGATFYVSPTGNDNNDGLTTATALATITAAARKAAALYVPGGSVNIQLTGYAGTQVLFVAPTLPSMSTPLTITGDVANPNNYRFYNTSGGVIGTSGLNVNLVGLQLYNQGNTYNTLSVSSGTVNLNAVNFDGIGGNNFSHIAVSPGGVLNINGNVQFRCNAQVPISMSGGVLTAGSAPGTVISTSAALTFTYILRLTKLASANFNPATVTWQGSFTGQKYLVDENAVLDCAGQASTYIPGSIAGQFNLGGVVN